MQPRSGGRAHRDVWFSVALAVVALAPRLFVALAWAREPVWDGHYYHFGAERIAAGLGYSEDVVIAGQSVWKPWTHYPVGYSGFLGMVYRLFGDDIVVAPLANAVVGALTAVLVHRLALDYLSPTRARVAGALCALHPGLIAYSAVVMTEPLAALLLLAAGYAVVRLRGRWQGIVAGGVILGAAALVRPGSLLAGPLLLFMHGSVPPLRALARTLAIGAVTLLTILPWTARNCRVMDGCALISTNGGWNLAIGALTTTGRFRGLRADDGCPNVKGQVHQDHCWSDVGKETIRRDPSRWLSMIPLKLSQTYDHESFAVEYLHEAAPEQWPEERRRAGRELLTSFHWALMVVASLSVVAWPWRRGHTAPRAPSAADTLSGGALRDLLTPPHLVQLALGVTWSGYVAYCATFTPPPPLYVLMALLPLVALLPLPGRPAQGAVGRYLLGLVGMTTLTHAIFFGDDRYHLVISPALCLLAAAALRAPSRFPATR